MGLVDGAGELALGRERAAEGGAGLAVGRFAGRAGGPILRLGESSIERGVIDGIAEGPVERAGSGAVVGVPSDGTDSPLDGDRVDMGFNGLAVGVLLAVEGVLEGAMALGGATVAGAGADGPLVPAPVGRLGRIGGDVVVTLEPGELDGGDVAGPGAGATGDGAIGEGDALGFPGVLAGAAGARAGATAGGRLGAVLGLPLPEAGAGETGRKPPPPMAAPAAGAGGDTGGWAGGSCCVEAQNELSTSARVGSVILTIP